MEACRMLYIGTVTASTNHVSYPYQRVTTVTTAAVAATMAVARWQLLDRCSAPIRVNDLFLLLEGFVPAWHALDEALV